MTSDWFAEAVVPILAAELKIAVLPQALGEIVDSTDGLEGGLDDPKALAQPPPGCWGRLFGKKKGKKGRVAPARTESENSLVRAKELVAAGSTGHGE